MRHLLLVLAACGSSPRVAAPAPRGSAPIACLIEADKGVIGGVCIGSPARVGDRVLAFDAKAPYAVLVVTHVLLDPDPATCPIFEIDTDLVSGDPRRFDHGDVPAIIARTPGLVPRDLRDSDWPKHDATKVSTSFAIDLDGDNRADFVALDGGCELDGKHDECISTSRRDLAGSGPGIRFGLGQCNSDRRHPTTSF